MAAGPVVRDLGRAEYLPTWRAMREFTAARSGETADELWIVEHPPVFTLGQGGRREHLLDPGEIPVVATDRGGQVTYHGPGQVVVYTLIDLRRLGIFVRELVYRIEQSVIQVLGESGIDAQRVRGAPGVYVRAAGSRAGGELAGFAKIAALGDDAMRREKIDDALFDGGDQFAHFDLLALQVEQQVDHHLAGAVVGDLAATVDLDDGDADIFEDMFGFAGLA